MANNMQLIDGEMFFNKTFEQYLFTVWSSIARSAGVSAPSKEDLARPSSDKVTYAYISHGRIVADCPNCNSAEFVWRNGPYIQVCANCGNADIGGMVRSVVMPSIRLDVIEQLLMKRTNPANRNWIVGETLEQLEAENEEHQV